MPASNQHCPPSHDISKKKMPKLNKKLKNVNKFRVAGYVVYFSIFFQKYTKSFTIKRFDEFKNGWCGQGEV